MVEILLRNKAEINKKDRLLLLFKSLFIDGK